VFAIRIAEQVLSNTWWPIAVHGNATERDKWEKVLALWFNSTLGIISLIAARVDTRGAWVEIKKPILEEIMVPDPRELSTESKTRLALAYDELSRWVIQPLPSINDDPFHKAIDEALTAALGIKDDLTRLREMLSREPIVSMHLPT
jgi:hypothetical protein